MERLGSLVVARVATSEDEALPTGRDDRRRHVRDADVGDRPHIRDFGVPTMSDPCVHDSTAILDAYVLGQHLGHRVPVAVRERRPVALAHLACRVFQPRSRTAELVEPRERGVEVCLVEEFDAVDQVAVDRRETDLPPLGLEALLATSRAPRR